MANIQVAVSLKERVVHRALDLGFDLVRVTSAEPFVEDGEAAQERMRHGFLDGMPWFTRERAQKASAPQSLLPGARSIIAVALSYLPLAAVLAIGAWRIVNLGPWLRTGLVSISSLLAGFYVVCEIRRFWRRIVFFSIFFSISFQRFSTEICNFHRRGRKAH